MDGYHTASLATAVRLYATNIGIRAYAALRRFRTGFSVISSVRVSTGVLAVANKFLLPPRAVTLFPRANNLKFFAALQSRSCLVPQSGQVQSRTDSGILA